jgi:transposase
MSPQLPASVRFYLYTKPTDLRKGFDGLQGMVREFLGQDLLSGHLFLFLNRRCNCIKVLLWDRDGFVIWYKQLEAGIFQQLDLPVCASRDSGEAGIKLMTMNLALLLTRVNLTPGLAKMLPSRLITCPVN